MRKWHDTIQNSEEWYKLRLGKITSSNFAKVCANMGKAFGEPAKNYARKKALERVTDQLDETENFKNSYMDRGHELEPIARMLYEEETFNHVSNGGFYEMGTYGDSPDGLIGKSGCVEIKCVVPNTHWKRIEKGGIDPAYKWQVQGHLFVSGREWCDFISYCPEFAPGKQLFIHRVERDMFLIKQLQERLEEFELLIQEKERLIAN